MGKSESLSASSDERGYRTEPERRFITSKAEEMRLLRALYRRAALSGRARDCPGGSSSPLSAPTRATTC